MKESILLAQIAGRRIALPASQIESIIEIGKITPVPKAPAYIAGLSTLRSQALTVINCARALKGEECQISDRQEAAVVKYDGHHYALLLEAVEDVVEPNTDPTPVLGGVGDGWSNVALGMIETEAGPAMLVDVNGLIDVEAETAH